MSQLNERDTLVYKALTNGLKRFLEKNDKQKHFAEKLTKKFNEFYDSASISNTSILSRVEKLASDFAPKCSNASLKVVTNSIYIEETRKNHKEETQKSKDKYFYGHKALALSENIFPKENSSQDLTSQNAYWKSFEDEYNKLPDQNFLTYFESLVYLLHKYTWCLPARTETDFLEVSLYDQSRITAALAACLYDFNDSTQIKAGKEEILLIEGDISGIQKFIYNPAFNGQELQDGIARRLRGRSFYLNLLLKTLTDYLTQELNLYSINVLWATGGHFLVIAPNTETTKKKLNSASKIIQEWFWEEFRGALSLIIADLSVNMEQLKNFSVIRSHLGQITAKLKLQQFSTPLEIVDSSLDKAWQSSWVLEMQEDICCDTGRDISQNEIDVSNFYQKEEENPKLRSSHSLNFDRIGRVLIEAKTIQLRRNSEWNIENSKHIKMPKNKVEAEKKEQFSLGQWLIEFPKLKRCWLLSNNVEPVLGADLCLRIANHKNPEISFLSNNKTTSQGFEFLADAVATEKNETGRKQIVEFHKLAGKAKEAGAAEFLGVLRMDVDNLGYVFAKGFTEEKDKSIAKVANLSRMLDMFFTGYLNTLVDNHNLYITYAGGDDLFIVGAWNEVIDLAETINEKFKAYCGNNPSLHISGAVALCKGKYPIGRAAEESGELLDNKAKNLKYKNALAFMNKAIAWDDWPAVKDTAKKIIEGLEKGTVSRSFIYNLLALYNQYIDVSSRDQKKNTTAHLLLVPKFLYSLVRNVTDKNLCIELETMIHKQQAYLSVIAGYAALKTRFTNGKD